MKRREFVKNTALGGAIALTIPRMFNGVANAEFANSAASDFLENDSIMIIIELFGGNDGLNTVIPIYDDNYYRLRPRVAIAAEDAERFQNTDLYMHPALVRNVVNDGFMGLLANGNLAVIENIGYKNYSMSHFRSSDIWASGIQSTNPKVKLLDGWLGRYFASKLDDFPNIIPDYPLGIFIGGKVPLALTSQLGPVAIAFNNPQQFYDRGKDLESRFSAMSPDSFHAKEFNYVNLIAKQCAQYSRIVKAANDNGKNAIEYSQGNLSQQFKTIARLISGGLPTKVYYVRLSNFDSHVQQMDEWNIGQHPQLLSGLSRAVSEFILDATSQGFMNRVAGMTVSEFGRRPFDNGGRGTDHGGASVSFVFAADQNIFGGRIGEPPRLDALDDFGNLPPQVDFRRIYADFLESWFGASRQESINVFGEEVFPQGILRKRFQSVENTMIANTNGSLLQIMPNPSRGDGAVSFTLKKSADVDVAIFNNMGLKELDIFSGYLENGEHKLNFSIPNPVQGVYHLSVVVAGQRITENLVVIK